MKTITWATFAASTLLGVVGCGDLKHSYPNGVAVELESSTSTLTRVQLRSGRVVALPGNYLVVYAGDENALITSGALAEAQGGDSSLTDYCCNEHGCTPGTIVQLCPAGTIGMQCQDEGDRNPGLCQPHVD